MIRVSRGSFARLPIIIPPKSEDDTPPPPTFRTETIGPAGRVGDFVVRIEAVCEAGCHALVVPAECDDLFDHEVIEVAELRPLLPGDMKKFGNREREAG